MSKNSVRFWCEPLERKTQEKTQRIVGADGQAQATSPGVDKRHASHSFAHYNAKEVAFWRNTGEELARYDASTMKLHEVSEEGIRLLIDAFYAKVRVDPYLAPVFERAITGDWGPHLATMRDFWSSTMLASGRYNGNPLAVHIRIEGMAPQLFDQWLRLFGETCDELFDDSVAQAFRIKAERIAESLKLGLFYRPTARK